MTQISNKKMFFFTKFYTKKFYTKIIYLLWHYDTMAQLQYAEDQNHALMNIVIEW